MSANLDIRELDENDMRDYAHELTRLFNYLHSADRQNLDAWFVWFKAWGKVYGAFRDDKLVGMASVILIPKPYGFVAQIEDVAVAEGNRKQGIGSKLIKFIEGEAKRANWCYKITLACSDAKVRWYSKLGYVGRANYMRKDI